MGFGLTYIEAHLEMAQGSVLEITGDLDGALSGLIGGENAIRNAGETVMAIVTGNGRRTKGHLTESVC